MCGIAGVLDPAGRECSTDLAAMLPVLAHRGPDDEGSRTFPTFAFGMRRLSILDPTPAGNQPMASTTGRSWIVYNGEIYNFLELARELESEGASFTNATDTQVILAAYERWGASCVEHFNGIWAFALWDDERQRLLLSRDRFGVKPLFLAERDGRLAFASEIKALLRLPWVSPDADPSAVRDFLVDGLVDHTDRTFFRSIRRLPAAHTLVIDQDGRHHLERYWGPPRLSDDATARPDVADGPRLEEIRALLIDAVALQLRSDVPVGSCLSGGLDSSSIVTIAAGLRDGRLRLDTDHIRSRESQPQLAFFAEFRGEGIDERRFVDEVIAATGVRLRTTTPTDADFMATIDGIVGAQDEPFPSTSIVAQYHVMRTAHAAGVKVLLDGQGADETFAGYPLYAPLAVAGGIRGGDALALRRGIRTLVRDRSRLSQYLGYLVMGGRPLPSRFRRGRIDQSWLGSETRRATPLEPRIDDVRGTSLATALWRQISFEHLPGLLRYEDRNSMAFSIEARVPYLDHRLVEAALLLPDRLKVAGTDRKVALRRAVEDIVPRAILGRRDKVAFQAPRGPWVRSLLGDQRFREGTPVALSLGLLDGMAFPLAVAAFERDVSEEPRLWRVLSVELWASNMVAGRPSIA